MIERDVARRTPSVRYKIAMSAYRHEIRSFATAARFNARP
jgi:hypothetical protein